MTIQKSILYTFLFFLFIQATAIWVSLNAFIDIRFLIYDYNIFISSVLEVIGIILFFFAIKSPKSLIPKKASILYCIVAIICGVLYAFAQKWLNLIYDVLASTDYANQMIYNFDFELNKFTLNSFASVIILPISEELFFRNYIQNGLQKNYKPFIAITIPSLLFALCHLPNIHYSYLVLFGGLISATLYYKSKSITPSFLFHMIWNLVIMINS